VRCGVVGEAKGGEGLPVCCMSRRGWGGRMAGWMAGWLEGEGRGRGVLQQEYAGRVCRLPATGFNHMTRPRAVRVNNTREQRGGGRTTFSLGALN